MQWFFWAWLYRSSAFYYITQCFLMDNDKPRTKYHTSHLREMASFEEIGEALGISPQLAGQIYSTAIRKIRMYLLRRKDLRYELQEGLEMLMGEDEKEFGKSKMMRGKNSGK